MKGDCPIRPAPGVPELVDQEMTAQFRAYAKQLQGEGKFGEALQGWLGDVVT